MRFLPKQRHIISKSLILIPWGIAFCDAELDHALEVFGEQNVFCLFTRGVIAACFFKCWHKRLIAQPISSLRAGRVRFDTCRLEFGGMNDMTTVIRVSHCYLIIFKLGHVMRSRPIRTCFVNTSDDPWYSLYLDLEHRMKSSPAKKILSLIDASNIPGNRSANRSTKPPLN